MSDALWDLVRCSICRDNVDKPKQLPCLHSFCLDCLRHYAPANATLISCPDCRSTCRLSSGVDGLPADFRLASLVDELVKLGQLNISDVISCDSRTMEDMCDMCDDNMTATKYCSQCHLRMCPLCCMKHAKNIGLQRHKLHPLNVLRFCDHHHCELNFVCQDCNIDVCVKCVSADHSTHSTVTLNPRARAKRAQKPEPEKTMKGVSLFRRLSITGVKDIVALDKGRLVVNINGKRLALTSTRGVVKRSFEGDIRGLSNTKSGDIAYVCGREKCVKIVDSQHLKLLLKWGKFCNPTGLAQNETSGYWAVGDEGRKKTIVICSENGRQLRRFGDSEEIQSLRNLTWIPNNKLVVSEWIQNKVTMYDDEGNLLTQFGQNSPANNDVIIQPRQILPTPTNTLVICDSLNHRLSEFTVDGVFLKHVMDKSDGLSAPTAAALDRKGTNLAIANCDAVSVFRAIY